MDSLRHDGETQRLGWVGTSDGDGRCPGRVARGAARKIGRGRRREQAGGAPRGWGLGGGGVRGEKGGVERGQADRAQGAIVVRRGVGLWRLGGFGVADRGDRHKVGRHRVGDTKRQAQNQRDKDRRRHEDMPDQRVPVTICGHSVKS